MDSSDRLFHLSVAAMQFALLAVFVWRFLRPKGTQRTPASVLAVLAVGFPAVGTGHLLVATGWVARAHVKERLSGSMVMWLPVVVVTGLWGFRRRRPAT